MDNSDRSLSVEPSNSELWEDAYGRVEAYFAALRIRNKLLLSQLVTQVLERAAQRLARGEATDATQAAIEEVEAFLASWFREVLGRNHISTPELLRRGRLALLLADAPARWPHAFLAAPPYPAEFLENMRAAYLEAGPDFQGTPMKVTAVDFGPLSSFAETSLRHLERWPVGRALLLWSSGIGLAVWLFLLTR